MSIMPRKSRHSRALIEYIHIIQHTQQSNPDGKDGKEFVLKAGFPPKDLIGDIENSIEACSLAGEAITVRWK